MMKLYKEFKEYYKEIVNYEKACNLIEWDLKTATPKDGVDGLVATLSMLSTKRLELQTSTQMETYLEKLLQPDNYSQLSVYEQKNIRRIKKAFDKEKNVPVDFYRDYITLVAKAEDVWEQAKIHNDFEAFCPYLEKIIEALKQMTNYTDPGKNPYDVLLDEFEEGVTQETIDGIMEELKVELIPLVKEIMTKPEPDSSRFIGTFEVEKQKELSKFLLEYIGFSFKRGTIAESEHPFTLNLSSKDVRITNHYYSDNIISAIYSIIHEGGHGIFEQNVDEAFDDTALTSCCFMGIHESQSRFYENVLGRNINFWKPIYAKLGELFPEYQSITIEEFYREINHIKNSLIRVDADEITFNFHNMIRYELEKALFDGSLAVKDLPNAWNQKMEEYLGIVPETDKEGVLQDSHWAGAAFGYFPSYVLGNIYDGMFLETMQEELGNLDLILKQGEIHKITAWLNEKIHRYGNSRLPMEVIEEVCHKPLDAKPFIRYIKDKYTKLYQL